MEFKLKEFHRKITDSQFIDDLIAVSKKIGKDTLTADEYGKHGKYHYLTIRKRFGSWYAALTKAGLKPGRMPNIYPVNETALLNNIEDVWIKLGKQPCEKQMKYPLSRYGRSTYLKYFGTWMNALRKFIEYKNSRATGANEFENRPEPVAVECTPVEKDTREIPFQLRVSVFIRDGFRCRACGRSPVTHPGVVLHCDHINAWGKGGRSIMNNLQTLCAECNFGKGDMDVSNMPGR